MNTNNVNRISKVKSKLPTKFVKSIGTLLLITVCLIVYMNFLTEDPEVTLTKGLSLKQLSKQTSVESVMKSIGTSNASLPGVSGSGSGVTADDEKIIMMSETECWKYLTNDIFSSQPQGSWGSHKAALDKLESANKVPLKIKCWVWKKPDKSPGQSSKDLTKVESTDTIQVNAKLKDIWEHAFTDIFNDPSQPVWNTSDGGRGCYNNRAKRNNPANKPSTHAFGCAVDFNPATSVTVNGIHSGNGAGNGYHVLTEAEWNKLPETQAKYNCIYRGCAIEKIFKSYGFVWGGDWSNYRDVMHFSFIGEGTNTRKQGQDNYKKYKTK